MAALAGRLDQRGHEVTIFGIADSEAVVRAAGVRFGLIGEKDYPLGTLQKLDDRLSELKGFASSRFTLERIRDTAKMELRDGPEAARKARVEGLLVDEADFGGSVADYLRIPFVSVALIPPLLPDNRFPPFYFQWKAGEDVFRRARNQVAISFLTRVATPIFKVVNDQREAWGIGAFKETKEALSPLAQVTQMPRAFDFDIAAMPEGLYHTGPFVDPQQRRAIDFDWSRLDGRPLIYASLGTLQNGMEGLFRTIAKACSGLDAQLVMSLGGGLHPERLGPLEGDAVVVRFAPQLEILKRAAVVITHGGINTVLESLSEGVPLVVMPLGNDQPGVAARVDAHGVGKILSSHNVSAEKLRKAVKTVLEDGKYATAAKRMQLEMSKVDGLEVAADIIETAFGIGESAKTLASAAAS
jgi:MGT family glycosyltransferase